MGKHKFKMGDMAGPGIRDCELGEPCTLTDGELLAPKIPLLASSSEGISLPKCHLCSK